MPDWILNSKILTYLFTGLLVLVIIASLLGYVPESILLAAIGFLGFADVIAFRDWINSQGIKTYVVGFLGIAGTIALVAGWITPQVFIAILTIFTGSAAVTLGVGLKKAPAGAKLKAISAK